MAYSDWKFSKQPKLPVWCYIFYINQIFKLLKIEECGDQLTWWHIEGSDFFDDFSGDAAVCIIENQFSFTLDLSQGLSDSFFLTFVANRGTIIQARKLSAQQDCGLQ